MYPYILFSKAVCLLLFTTVQPSYISPPCSSNPSTHF
jgi:hypothetical protein